MPDYKPITGEQIHQAFQAAERKLHGRCAASYEVCAVNGIKEQYEELAERLNHLDTLSGHILYDLRRSISAIQTRPWEKLSPYTDGEGQGFYEYLAGLLRRARGERIWLVPVYDDAPPISQPYVRENDLRRPRRIREVDVAIQLFICKPGDPLPEDVFCYLPDSWYKQHPPDPTLKE